MPFPRISTLIATVLLGSAAMSAQSFKEWDDPKINEVNRLPMHANFFPYENRDKAESADKTESSNFLSLDGNWKFNWVSSRSQRPVDFYRTDFNDSAWSLMPVPGNWEMYGYGDPLYLNIGYAWRNDFKGVPPEIPTDIIT